MTSLAELIGESSGIMAVRGQIERLLRRQVRTDRLPPILIQGETGTGKGLLARAIHQAGPRAAGPFVDVNCAAIPETLLEAELFGFERGAFTDAHQAKLGLFQAAHWGTIFLDEIGLLPEGLQAKLLKVLDERVVRRLGSTRSEPVDVSILAASNEDLAAAVRARRFREDLYHRLAVLTLWLPPLRERGQDILLLAEHFLARASADYGLPPKTLDPEAVSAILAYAWPGNVRELANVIERVSLLADAPVVTAEQLGLPAPSQAGPSESEQTEAIPLKSRLEGVEREQLLEALRQTNWNISRTAARLGVSRSTLRYRIEKHSLSPRASGSALRPRPVRAPAVSAAAPVAAPGSTPPPAGLRWERRHLTLLRAAVVAPAGADLPHAVSRAVELLAEKVKAFGGRVEERGPMGIVAAFGLEPVEDAPIRAAHAAMAIQKALGRAEHGSPEPSAVKVGIHAGQLMVGYSGSGAEIDMEAKHGEWTVLEELLVRADPDAILVSDAAAPFLERRFELELVGTLQRTSGRIYRVCGRELTGYGLGGRPLSRFVGRGRELDILDHLLAQVVLGRGQVVGIVGEPGVGKSRLLYEFTRSERTPGCRILEGSSVSYGTSSPYLPVIDLLRGYFQIDDRDPPRRVREKIAAKLFTLHRTLFPLEPILPPLFALLDVPVEDPAWQTLDPPQRRQRTLDAVKRLLLRESQAQPLVLIFEDLHWIDAETQACLDSFVEGFPTARILLLVTYRPESQHGWGHKTYYTQLRIDPLPPESAEELLQALLGDDPGLRPLKPLLIERTEGNPFFLEESVRALVETQVLVGERGRYRLAKALQGIQVPATVEAVLAARIGRLPPEEKHLLQAAAVIGKDVPFALLQAVAEAPEEAVHRGLGRLQAAEFLYEASLPPDLEYTFKHTLTHEVAYGSLLPERRRALHARIVEVIESLHPDRLAEHVERLAHHAFRGEVWEKALAYLRRAGAKAFARSANREAAACFEQALEALQHLPESRDTMGQAVDLRLDLRHALWPLEELGRIFDALREAEALAAALDDQRRLGRVSSYMAGYFWLMGDHERAIESGQRGLALAETLDDFPLQVVAILYLGLTHHAMGDYRRSIEVLRRNILSLEGDLIHERFGMPGLPSVISRHWSAWSLAEMGEFAEGIARGEEAVRVAEEGNQPYSLASAYLGVGVLHLINGDPPKAISFLERSLGLCQVWHFPLLFPWAASALGHAYALSGRVAEALPLLEQAVEQAASTGRMGYHSLRVSSLGEAYLLAGRADRAMELAQHALHLSRHHKERGHEAWALRLLGETHSHRDPPEIEKAERHYRQALALANELGMRPLLARCHLGLGRLYRRTRHRQNADGHLTTAIALSREMDMPFWLAQAEAALSEG